MSRPLFPTTFSEPFLSRRGVIGHASGVDSREVFTFLGEAMFACWESVTESVTYPQQSVT